MWKDYGSRELALKAILLKKVSKRSWVSNQGQSVWHSYHCSWGQAVVDIMGFWETHNQFTLPGQIRDSQDIFLCLLCTGLIGRGISPNSDYGLCGFCGGCELFDIRFMGVHHTWCQKPKMIWGFVWENLGPFLLILCSFTFKIVRLGFFPKASLITRRGWQF
ncbi:hypothetical protein OSB04_un001318 [Centaurea solstitialis]|uniref:Uncharacterized protein n=1 Tax=Centaurea solstitialis TaxID=347529 RepID=A0AA38SAZ4_9ASTR|nr:hypothetical protein OSB04_un001318 [Centaurea solstitialis]